MDTNKTPNFAEAARIPTLFNTRIDLSLILALVLLFIFWYLMKYTRWGLEIRAIGGNTEAQRRYPTIFPSFYGTDNEYKVFITNVLESPY